MQPLSLFALAVFVTCITPGTTVLFTLQNAFKYGLRKAFVCPTGNAIGAGLMTILAATSVGAVIQASPVLFLGLQTLGACLLFFFAWRNWRAPTLNLAGKSAPAEGQKQEGFKIIANAVMLQATNPILIVFLLSLLPQFIDPNMEYTSQVVLLVAIFVSICFMVHIFYSYSAAFAAKKFMGPKFSFWLNKISAVTFLFLGGSVLTTVIGAI